MSITSIGGSAVLASGGAVIPPWADDLSVQVSDQSVTIRFAESGPPISVTAPSPGKVLVVLNADNGALGAAWQARKIFTSSHGAVSAAVAWRTHSVEGSPMRAVEYSFTLD